LRAATEAIKSKPLPVKLIAAVSAVFIMISIVVVVVVKRAQEAAKKQAIADAIARIESERKKDRDESARLQKALSDRLNEAKSLEEQVNAAKTEKERLELADRAKAAASAACTSCFRRRCPAGGFEGARSQGQARALQERRRPTLRYLTPAPTACRFLLSDRWLSSPRARHRSARFTERTPL
jgi:hypothetical protein